MSNWSDRELYGSRRPSGRMIYKNTVSRTPKPDVSEEDALRRAIWDAVEEHIDSAPSEGLAADGRHNVFVLNGERKYVDGLRAARGAALAAVSKYLRGPR